MYGGEFTRVSGDVWNIPLDNSENEAYDKIKLAHRGEGVTAYGVLYRWLTDASGQGLAEQARMLMHPRPPKREEDLAEHVEMRQDTMRSLEAHGEEFKLAPLLKISSLRTLMTGKAKEYFDVWEADHDTANLKKKYEELLNKVKDYVRRRKLDAKAKERTQQEGDSTDVETVGGWSWEDYDQEGVCAIGFKSKSKGKEGKGEGDCYN